MTDEKEYVPSPRDIVVDMKDMAKRYRETGHPDSAMQMDEFAGALAGALDRAEQAAVS